MAFGAKYASVLVIKKVTKELKFWRYWYFTSEGYEKVFNNGCSNLDWVNVQYKAEHGCNFVNDLDYICLGGSVEIW